MVFEVEYFHPRVLLGIEGWPVDVLADYARLIELLIEHGPSLRLPHSRALGEGDVPRFLGPVVSGKMALNPKGRADEEEPIH
jgi:hypothetical protein